MRHAFSKPFIHMIEQGQHIPFDIAQQRAVFYKITDLDSVDAAKTAIRQAAEEIIAGGEEYKVDSPVSRSVDLDRLRKSGDPEQVALADIQSSMDELRAEMQRLKTPPRPMIGLAEVEAMQTVMMKLASEGRMDMSHLRLLEAALPGTKGYSLWAKRIRAEITDPFGTRAPRNDDPFSSPPADPAGFTGADDEPPF